ncbi:MAG TPA: hypothetical protein VMD53_13445 [Rhizomicrobium sp.]|nr:hypothetical protein [Rhizomicrobium sp.]
MRIAALYAFAGVLLSCCPLAAAETPVTPTPAVAPSLTVEQPTNPVASAPGGPLLQSISAHLTPQILNMTPQMIVPDFHFIAPNGNAVLLHRDLVDTNANNMHVAPAQLINVPAEDQKRGAVISGGFRCSTSQYYVTMRAYILAADGTRSNSVQYTIHCNGG